MKNLLLASLLAMTCAVQASPIEKDAADHFAAAARMTPAGSLPPPSDLSTDASFGPGGSGWNRLSLDNGDKKMDVALRVFPAAGDKYWLVGYNRKQPVLFDTPDLVNLVIARVSADGSFDDSWANLGVFMQASMLNELTDVVSLGNKFYFVGNRISLSTDWDVAIQCIDTQTLAFCPGFGNGTIAYLPVDLGDSTARRNDFSQRASGCGLDAICVVGTADAGSGSSGDFAAFVMKVNAANGMRDTAFAPSSPKPGVFVRNLNYMANGYDIAYDLVVRWAGSPIPLPSKILVVGTTQNSANDTDGFLFAVDAADGAPDPAFTRLIYFDLGDTNMQDKATRIMMRANGKYLVAGTARDDASDDKLFLAQFTAAGQWDSSFGDGGTRVGTNLYGNDSVPYALAERQGTGANRDIVIGLDSTYTVDDDGHVRNEVIQVDGNGGLIVHASNSVDPDAATGQMQQSNGHDLFIDGQQRVVVAGTTRWSETNKDWDMTMARFTADDSIFADQFGGNSSD